VNDPVVFSIFLIFSGAALLATLALYVRQSLIVAYIALGLLLGPAGLGWVGDVELLRDISQIGIVFLLFLLGLNLLPQKLLQLFREAVWVTLGVSLACAFVGFAVASLAGLAPGESLLVGVAVSFSSTILGVKLLPTTVLHHQRIGGIIVSVLLLEDLIAIAVLLSLHGAAQGDVTVMAFVRLVAGLVGVLVAAFVLERVLLRRLFMRFDRIHEYVFLVTLGWCLGVAAFAHGVGLSYEIGAFIAGVALASGPIALYIAESLKPLRDFFLVLFFFALGAGFNLSQLPSVWLPALALAALLLVFKPFARRALLTWQGEKPSAAWEVGVRLGQISEFALLIVALAAQGGLMSSRAAQLVQLATLITFVASSYYIVARFHSPLALTDKLRRD
jgi:Kef-type K+ transport system membrane component KefB